MKLSEILVRYMEDTPMTGNTEKTAIEFLNKLHFDDGELMTKENLLKYLKENKEKD